MRFYHAAPKETMMKIYAEGVLKKSSGAWSAQHDNCSAWRGCDYYLFHAEWCNFAGYGIFD